MAARGRGPNTSLAITALCTVQLVDVLGVTVMVAALISQTIAPNGYVRTRMVHKPGSQIADYTSHDGAAS